MEPIEFKIMRDEDEYETDELYVYIYYYADGSKYEIYTHDCPPGLTLNKVYPIK